MLKPVGLDRAALRRSFNEKRSGAQRADFLLAEVERRLDERLEPMRRHAAGFRVPGGRTGDRGSGIRRLLADSGLPYSDRKSVV